MPSKLLVTLLALPFVSSCALLPNFPTGPGGINIVPPTITFQGATLARAPTQHQLAAYYCPEVVSIPFGGAPLLCQGFFGPRPAPADMVVAFDLTFNVSNPNTIPIPMASVLTAVTVFPAATNQSLGAVCMQLCPAGQPGCNGQPAPGACQASSRDIRSLNDFANATLNLLIADGIAAAAGQPPTFVAPSISASAQLQVTVRFTFGPEQLLGTVRQLAAQSVNELKAGRLPSFNIPYRLEGTIWFDGGSFGRLAVPFGPTDGVWVLPT
jgi:hypothetical protein